ncbi:type III toxin-antitoxin system ToxN/AbiQ family toxin [Paenibacillus wenxiniae]|uniref:type III toxin-antitoxin system ToxN/AbiQ family toxin n=1 Tax=Paenibacillus wenxiniae TaxID=1636843 RepID=UPI0035301B9D
MGTLFHINGHDYYAPLSSYKESYKKKKAWFAKVYNGSSPEPVAVLKYCCMIPVKRELLEYIDFTKHYTKYRDLLESEYQYLKTNRSTIIEQAKSIYEKVTIQKILILFKFASILKS